jgi:hypothetical protein
MLNKFDAEVATMTTRSNGYHTSDKHLQSWSLTPIKKPTYYRPVSPLTQYHPGDQMQMIFHSFQLDYGDSIILL